MKLVKTLFENQENNWREAGNWIRLTKDSKAMFQICIRNDRLVAHCLRDLYGWKGDGYESEIPYSGLNCWQFSKDCGETWQDIVEQTPRGLKLADFIYNKQTKVVKQLISVNCCEWLIDTKYGNISEMVDTKNKRFLEQYGDWHLLESPREFFDIQMNSH